MISEEDEENLSDDSSDNNITDDDPSDNLPPPINDEDLPPEEAEPPPPEPKKKRGRPRKEAKKQEPDEDDLSVSSLFCGDDGDREKTSKRYFNSALRESNYMANEPSIKLIFFKLRLHSLFLFHPKWHSRFFELLREVQRRNATAHPLPPNTFRGRKLLYTTLVYMFDSDKHTLKKIVVKRGDFHNMVEAILFDTRWRNTITKIHGIPPSIWAAMSLSLLPSEIMKLFPKLEKLPSAVDFLIYPFPPSHEGSNNSLDMFISSDCFRMMKNPPLLSEDIEELLFLTEEDDKEWIEKNERDRLMDDHEFRVGAHYFISAATLSSVVWCICMDYSIHLKETSVLLETKKNQQQTSLKDSLIVGPPSRLYKAEPIDEEGASDFDEKVKPATLLPSDSDDEKQSTKDGDSTTLVYSKFALNKGTNTLNYTVSTHSTQEQLHLRSISENYKDIKRLIGDRVSYGTDLFLWARNGLERGPFYDFFREKFLACNFSQYASFGTKLLQQQMSLKPQSKYKNSRRFQLFTHESRRIQREGLEDLVKISFLRSQVPPLQLLHTLNTYKRQYCRLKPFYTQNISVFFEVNFDRYVTYATLQANFYDVIKNQLMLYNLHTNIYFERKAPIPLFPIQTLLYFKPELFRTSMVTLAPKTEEDRLFASNPKVNISQPLSHLFMMKFILSQFIRTTVYERTLMPSDESDSNIEFYAFLPCIISQYGSSSKIWRNIATSFRVDELLLKRDSLLTALASFILIYTKHFLRQSVVLRLSRQFKENSDLRHNYPEMYSALLNMQTIENNGEVYLEVPYCFDKDSLQPISYSPHVKRDFVPLHLYFYEYCAVEGDLEIFEAFRAYCPNCPGNYQQSVFPLKHRSELASRLLKNLEDSRPCLLDLYADVKGNKGEDIEPWLVRPNNMESIYVLMRSLEVLSHFLKTTTTNRTTTTEQQHLPLKESEAWSNDEERSKIPVFQLAEILKYRELASLIDLRIGKKWNDQSKCHETFQIHGITLENSFLLLRSIYDESVYDTSDRDKCFFGLNLRDSLVKPFAFSVADSYTTILLHTIHCKEKSFSMMY